MYLIYHEGLPLASNTNLLGRAHVYSWSNQNRAHTPPTLLPFRMGFRALHNRLGCAKQYGYRSVLHDIPTIHMGSNRQIDHPNHSIGFLGDLVSGNEFLVCMRPLGSIAIGAYLLDYVLGGKGGSRLQK